MYHSVYDALNKFKSVCNKQIKFDLAARFVHESVKVAGLVVSQIGVLNFVSTLGDVTNLFMVTDFVFEWFRFLI